MSYRWKSSKIRARSTDNLYALAPYRLILLESRKGIERMYRLLITPALRCNGRVYTWLVSWILINALICKDVHSNTPPPLQENGLLEQANVCVRATFIYFDFKQRTHMHKLSHPAPGWRMQIERAFRFGISLSLSAASFLAETRCSTRLLYDYLSARVVIKALGTPNLVCNSNLLLSLCWQGC